ncbi:MAG: Cache 3/Cache 2 fusion domain-containing protein [Candidatus Omnitrophica bacterium]|nr:Cache 3/Cache 2 fusion domain-containing protein [Candidatus Omnitrophota bacterium]
MKLKYRFSQVLVFCVFILPIIVMALFSYANLRRDLNEVVLARRNAMAELAATFMKEKLDRMVDLGISFVSRPSFAEFVKEGKWKEASDILKNTLADFPFIHLFFLTDTKGTLKAGYPKETQLIGQNFAFRDWYKGVSRDWKPYVSEVYETRYEPFYKVVAISVPIKDELDAPLGIMAFLVKLDVFAQWIEKYKFGQTGFLFVVDHKGHLVAHPKFHPQGDIIDFLGHPAVTAVLRGKDGIGILYSPTEKEERLTAFKPVPGYGWGCVVTQSVKEAFHAHDETLKVAIILYLVIFCLLSILMVFILRYISVRRAAEEKMRRLNAELARRVIQLKDLNKELEAFSYSVSHDLRAPLRSIDGFSRIILEENKDNLDERGKDHFQRIRVASGHMTKLIEDLLLLARVSRCEMHFDKVDLSGLAQKIADDLSARHPQRDVEFSIARGIFVRGDKMLLEQALINLLENSWKFTSKHARAKIEFGLFKENGEDVYFVRDDGAGFDMRYAGKLFGAFQRLHSDGEFPGTGVGLSMVQRIIHRHGGRIWADASVEKGATFYFTLLS